MCPTEEQEVMDGRPPFRRRAHPAGEERVRRPSPVRQEIRLSSAAPPRFIAAVRFLFLSAAFLVLSGRGQAYNQAR